MLTLLAVACSNHVNVSGFIWVAYCRPTINSTKMILCEKEKKNICTNWPCCAWCFYPLLNLPSNQELLEKEIILEQSCHIHYVILGLFVWLYMVTLVFQNISDENSLLTWQNHDYHGTLFQMVRKDFWGRDWKDGSVVKSICYSCKGPRVICQHPQGASQPFVCNSTFRGSNSIFWPPWAPNTLVVHMCICWKTLKHKIKWIHFLISEPQVFSFPRQLNSKRKW